MVEPHIVSVGTWLLSKIADKGFEEVSGKFQPSEIDSKFGAAVDVVCDCLSEKYPSILGGSMEIFFKEEEVFNELFKLLFKQSKINLDTIKEKLDLKTLPDGFVEEFVTNLKNELLKDKIFDDIFGNNQIYLSILGIEENIEKIANNSELSTEDISQIKSLLSERFKNKFNYDQFLDSYKKTAVNNLSQVNYFGLGISMHITKNRKNLSDIYVKPYFQLSKSFPAYDVVNEAGELIMGVRDCRLTIGDLFQETKNLVILGDPGSGKSLLVKYVMCSILDSRDIGFVDKSILEYLPFRIELRNYLPFKKEKNCNIVKYLLTKLETEYSISGITEEQLTEILNQQKTFIFFDGLDEIFDIANKFEVKNDIENFVKLFPKTKAIVTSRFIGYEEAKLNEKLFTEFTILDFDNHQIEEYVNKWYKFEEQNREIRQFEVSQFLQLRHGIDANLIRNPLLLSLIIILYRHNRELPSSKLEIYRSCTKTLVDRWDAIKNLQININETVKKYKENIFANLAFWQYEKLSMENGTININFMHVLNEVTKIITQLKLTLDDFEAEKWAEEFLVYAQKRSLYFDNNFTHKTFLEYFTAFWIYKYYFLKGEIKKTISIINKYINNSYWDIVIELLINMIDENQGDSDVIDNIFEKTKDKKRSKVFYLGVLPSIKHISDSVAKQLIYESIKEIVKTKKKMVKKSGNDLFMSLRPLLFKEKFIRLFQDSYDQLYEEIKGNKDLEKRYLAFGYEISGHPVFYTGKRPIRKILINNFSDNLGHLIKEDATLFFLDSAFLNIDFVDKTIEYANIFGNEALFYNNNELYFWGRNLGAYIRLFLNRQFLTRNINSVALNLEKLRDNGIDIMKMVIYLRIRALCLRVDEKLLKELALTINETHDKSFLLLIFSALFRSRIMINSDEREELYAEIGEILKTSPYRDLFLNILENYSIQAIFDELGFDYAEFRKEANQYRLKAFGGIRLLS